MEITEALKNYDASVHPKGETLPDSVRVFRVRVVTSFLKAGIPLSKVDSFRDLLEEGGYSDRSNVTELIPFINGEEVNRVKEEVSGKQVALIYDGTSHAAEALVIMLRYVIGNQEIHQHVCRLKLLPKSSSGDELAHELISCLSTA